MKANYKFSLPYREGMEKEPGFVEMKEGAQKGHPGETKFAYFAFEQEFNREQVKKTDEELIALAASTLFENAVRSKTLGTYAGKYGIQVAGAEGGVGKNDVKLITLLWGAFGGNAKKVYEALQTSDVPSAKAKALTQEEITDLMK